MLLMTSNPEKYKPIKDILINMGILPVRTHEFKELQTENAVEAIRFKADQVRRFYNGNFVVDDTMLVLNKYGNFPGPYTKSVLSCLGQEGMTRLTERGEAAEMVCYMGGYYNDNFICSNCRVKGKFDCFISVDNDKMKLSSWFLPDKKYEYPFPHRVVAAQKIAAYPKIVSGDCNIVESCIFCDELEDPNSSVYKDIIGDTYPSCRIVKETDSFVLMPPLGEFMEGGLLVMTKSHIISMAWLADAQFEELAYLLTQVKKMSREIWNSPVLIFEHGPYTPSTKNCNCVSHAHLNIFPVSMDISLDLNDMYSITLDSLSELKCLRDAADYILLIDNNDNIKCFFPKEQISQLIRKIITRKLGFPERGHWMDYLGLNEFGKTLEKCRDYFLNESLARHRNYENLNTRDIAFHWDDMAPYWDSLSKSPLMHYNRDGSYDAFSSIAKTYVEDIKPTSILEIGCGTGSLLQSLPPKLKKYGIDISNEMIGLAKDKNIENAEFFIHDIFSTPYPIPSVQMILSRGILLSHYGKRNAKVLIRYLHDFLPEGGIFIFDALLKANDEFARNKHIYNFDEIRRLFDEVGFLSTKLLPESAELRTQIITAIK